MSGEHLTTSGETVTATEGPGDGRLLTTAGQYQEGPGDSAGRPRAATSM